MNSSDSHALLTSVFSLQVWQGIRVFSAEVGDLRNQIFCAL